MKQFRVYPLFPIIQKHDKGQRIYFEHNRVSIAKAPNMCYKTPTQFDIRRTTLDTHLWRHVTYVVAILFALMIAFLLKPSFVPHTRGILLPATTQHFPANHGDVKLLMNLPQSYNLVGLIRLQRNYSILSKADERDMLRKAKQLAKQQGANGLWIGPNGFGHSAPNDVLGKTLIMQAVAIKV